MYINNIKKFIGVDFNYSKKDFLEILESSNSYGFDAYKLEKDFLLTVILIFIGRHYKELIFKGGTCLNKIYLDYFRLSEDLDFVVINKGNRTERKAMLEDYKQRLTKDLAILGLEITDQRTKYNEDRQGIFNFSYTSLIDNSPQNIQIDITMKEQLEIEPASKHIKSIFISKTMEESIFVEHTITCMEFDEIVAEKTRASLTRTQPAIRDFFDVWYIKNFAKFDFDKVMDLIEIKLEESNHEYTIDESFDLLERQIETDLKPVLKKNFEFDLKEIFEFIKQLKTKK
ncbi:MAG TPA: nucleotidyl transferase AbiEii/AbiGii toxin family protein [Candidatus Absconditabacterales bacterium]|nr:nucleotidyl transferase AbiEii/AbiGii toxin family protein [Candidatus Absconditabacterales bacterium]